MEWNGINRSGMEWNGVESSQMEWNRMECNGMEWTRTERQRLTKSNPISCQILLYKSRSKGRKNQRSTRTHCHHPSPKIYSASAKEPWILATNLPVEIRTPKQLVNIYSKRMQIEETFRDLKSPAYGLGLRHSRTSSSERFDIMLLIALMLQLTCWLAGVHAQKQGWDKHFQANTVRNRNVLSTVRLGMEVLGKAQELVGKYYNVEDGAWTDIQERHYLWKIPDSEFNYNKAMNQSTDQNPGYTSAE